MANDVNPSAPRAPTVSQRRRLPLSRAMILRGALHLVDREGPSSLTMRRLGEELGTGTMSVYHYVPDRESLLDGIGELLVRQVTVEPADGDWEGALRQFIRGIRAVALAHPHAFQLVGMRPLGTPEALPPIEALLRHGALAGRDRVEAFCAYRTAAAFGRGFALAEILGLTLEGGATLGIEVGGVDAHRYPHLAQALSDPSSRDHDVVFEYGLEAIVRGLSA